MLGAGVVDAVGIGQLEHSFVKARDAAIHPRHGAQVLLVLRSCFLKPSMV